MFLGRVRPVLKLEDGSEMLCRVLIGADGDRSEIAHALGLSSAHYAGNVAIRYGFVVSFGWRWFCRGISEFDQFPIPENTFRFFYGHESRAGMHQVERNKLYWFIVFNAPKVSCAQRHLFDGIEIGHACRKQRSFG